MTPKTNTKTSGKCFSHESPRSGLNVSGLRPSFITKHSSRHEVQNPSLRSSLSPAQQEGCFSVINDGLCPGKTPSLRADSRGKSSRQSPRSGLNVFGLRPSFITKHSSRHEVQNSSLRSSLSPAQQEGCFSVINGGRSPRKTPSLRADSRGKSSTQGACHG